VIQRRKESKKYTPEELFTEIMRQVGLAAVYSGDIVLAHVIQQEDMGAYRAMFAERGLTPFFILLRPQYETAETAAHNCVIDNTALTIEETAEWVLQEYRR